MVAALFGSTRLPSTIFSMDYLQVSGRIGSQLATLQKKSTVFRSNGLKLH